MIYWKSVLKIFTYFISNEAQTLQQLLYHMCFPENFLKYLKTVWLSPAQCLHKASLIKTTGKETWLQVFCFILYKNT